MIDIPIRRAHQLKQLNGKEILQGYRDAMDCKPEIAGSSYSYRHGYRNGLVDSSQALKSKAQAELARDVCRNQPQDHIS